MPQYSRGSGSCCSAVGCSMRRGTNLLSQIKMFRFPADPARRASWCNALKRANWTPNKNSLICNAHFITGKPSSDSQHPDYVPSIFHFNKKAAEEGDKKMNRYERSTKRKKNNSVTQDFNINNGKPSSLLDEKNPDWAPSLKLGYSKSEVHGDQEKAKFPLNSKCAKEDFDKRGASIKKRKYTVTSPTVQKKQIKKPAEVENETASTHSVEMEKDTSEVCIVSVTGNNTSFFDGDNQSPDSRAICYENSELQISKTTDSEHTLASEDEIDKIFQENTDNSCCEYNDSKPGDSEAELRWKLKVMTSLYKKTQKKLKHCQEQCKLYVKQVIALEEVIDNLKQINSVTDYS